MSLFRIDYNRPGPGVGKDEPRKTGVRRLLEVLSRDFRDLVKLNLLFCACALPTAALFFLGVFIFYSIPVVALSIFAAIPVGGALAASMFCITKMLRDELVFLWDDFKRKFLENVKQAAAPGMLCTVFIYAQVLLWGSMMTNDAGMDIAWVIAGLIILLLFSIVAPYVFMQIAYIDLKLPQIIKNSVILSLANAKRNFMGAVLGNASWFASVLFFPITIVFIPLIIMFGFTLPWLLCMMWIWPPFNKQFAIEATQGDGSAVS